MTRETLRSAVCFCLLPLLVAMPGFGQIAPPSDLQSAPPNSSTQFAPPLPDVVTVPKGTRIDLVLLDPVSSAQSVRGETIHYGVVNDVIVSGVTVIHRGTIVEGTVTEVTRAIAHKKDGNINFHPETIAIGNQKRIALSDRPPMPPMTAVQRKMRRDNLVRAILLAPIEIAVFPLWFTVMAIGMSGEGGPPEGRDVAVEPGRQRPYFAKSTLSLRVADLAHHKSPSIDSVDPGNLASGHRAMTNPQP